MPNTYAATNPKKFLDADGLAHFAQKLNEYPTNDVIVAVIDGVQDALDEKVDNDKVGVANGVASLGSDGKIPVSQLPGGSSDTTYTLTQDQTDGHVITLTPSSGSPMTVTIPDNDTTYSPATHSADGLMSSADKTKLDGIAENATANLGTITGITMNGASKGTSGVVDLGTVLTEHQDISGKADKSEIPTKVSQLTNDSGYTTNTGTITGIKMNGASKGSSGVVDLGTVITAHQDISGKADKSEIPTKVSELTNDSGFTANVGTITGITMNGASKGTSGVVNLGTVITSHQDISGKLNTSLKGAANGLAELDENGKVPSSQLPSYVDDVLEFANKDSFPLTGEAGKIYVDKTTNKTYRWGGSDYVEISPSLALGTTSSTAFRGDHGNTAYVHATAKGSAYNSGLYKITTNSEGHVTNAVAVEKSDITALGIPSTNTTYAFDGTYNASTNKAATVSTVANAIGALDGNLNDTAPGAGKTLTTFSQTDGKVNATFGNISITKSQVSDLGTIGAAAAKGVDTSIAAASTSTNLPTSKAVAAFVEGKGYKTTDNNTTYSLTQDETDGHKITLTPSSGTAQTITIPDNNTWRPVSDSVSSTSSSDAASSKAVKTAYDLAASKTANTGTVTKVSTGIGLTGGDITTTGTVKAKLKSETAHTADSATPTNTANRQYAVGVDKSGYLSVNVPWTDTNTKVTSAANHYAPSTASGSDVSASASGATAAWSIDVVKGITLNTDGKGHVTGMSVTSGKIPANPNTDTKNTAGSTDSSKKLFLIGAESQAANPQTYSHDTAYVGTDGCLYSGGTKVLTAHQDISGKVNKSGDTMSGKLTLQKGINEIITGTGTAGQTGSASAAYKPALWSFNLGMTPAEGDRLTIKIPVAVVNAGVWMSVDNGTNYYPVACIGTSRLTTQYPVDETIEVVFQTGRTTALYGNTKDGAAAGATTANVTMSRWCVLNYYDANTTYSAMSSTEMNAGTATTSRVMTAKNLKAGLNAVLKATSGDVQLYGVHLTGQVPAPEAANNGKIIQIVNGVYSLVPAITDAEIDALFA